MSRRNSYVAAAVAVVLAGGAGLAASGAAGRPAPFRTSVEMVSLNVTVTDARQQVVRGLAESDFRVFEDGVPQEIEVFAGENVPLDVALLLDTSASVGPRIKVIQSAAVGFLKALRPGDRASLVGFSETVRTLATWTEDLEEVQRAVLAARPHGGTAMFNALYVAVRGFQQETPTDGQVRRKALVVLSDGEDTSSLLSFDDVLEACQRAGLAVYTIQLRKPQDLQARLSATRKEADGEYALRELARQTGARAFHLTQVQDLAGTYGKIAEELSSQYLLAYAPKATGAAGPFRRLQVTVPGRPGAMPRARTGYYAAESVSMATGRAR